MRIVLFGAGGNIGRRIAQEGVARGHAVVGVVRDAARGAGPDGLAAVAAADVTDAAQVAAVAAGADAVVSAVGNQRTPTGPAPVPLFAEAARALGAGARAAGVARLVVVGGAGGLLTPAGVPLVDTPTFPPAYRGDALGQRDALAVYRADAGRDLAWTYVSPAAVIGPGDRTGQYRTGTDHLLVDADGESRISYEDFAVAIWDELERPRHVRARMTVAY